MADCLSNREWDRLRALAESRDELDTTALWLLMSTGITQDELVRIQPKDFDLGKRIVRVGESKEADARVLNYCAGLGKRMEHYLPEMRKVGNLGRVISTSKDADSQKRTVRRWVKALLSEAFGRNEHTVHSIRHTFAVRCLELTKNDLQAVQKILGHKHLATTALYLKEPEERNLRSVILNAG